MNFTCQFCKNRVYCRCNDCEIFLCSQCDYYEHYQGQSSLNEVSQTQNVSHKRVRICEECEEKECQAWCQNCEQFLCNPCNNLIHKKGARTKHKRTTNNLSPDLIRPSQTKSASSSIGAQNSQGRESESSRKNSTDFDYFTDQNSNQNSEIVAKKEKLNSSYTQKQTYYAKNNNEYKSRVSSYLPLGGGKPSTHQRGGGKGSSYSSGGSSSGSYQNTYNYKNRQDEYNQYQYGNRGQNKYKKGLTNFTGGQGLTSQQNAQELIPPQYFDGDKVVIPVWQPFVKCEESNQELIQLQKELFILAQKGDLLVEIETLISILQEKLQKQGYGQNQLYQVTYNQAFLILKVRDESYFLKGNRTVCINPIHYIESECLRIIETAEQQGIIHQTKRNFAKMKTLSFVSLQLDIISHECLQWVLTSLKKDEMTPSERQIQSRIKEAFAFKIASPLWDCILESIQFKDQTTEYSKNGASHRQVIINSHKGASYKHSYYNNNTYNDYYKYNNQNQYQSTKDKDYSEQYKQQYIYQDKKNDKSPEFEVREIEEDKSIGQMTKAIYQKEEELWIGVDQNTDEIDFELYEELKNFLHDYFCAPQETAIEDEEEEKWCSSIENALTRTITHHGNSKLHGQIYQQEIDLDEVRAIPGGRYGCAQFVKICGPENLRQCSLGRLAQLVQYAVKEDVLRYHKTLLVWTTTVDKHKKMAEELQKESHQKAAIAAKLQVVKNALIEILAESKSGMSLAQLPLYLRRKLPFTLDLNELGFPKLKDLILSMNNQIKLELRGHNHPFAYLIKSGRYIHSSSNSDDFQSIPKTKKFIQTQQPHLSEDVNISRHLKNALALNEGNIKNVLTTFFSIMREQPMGIKSDELPKILSQRLGQEFEFKNYGCHSLLEFIKKFILPQMDIEIISTFGYAPNANMGEQDSFLIRSKQLYNNYYQQQNPIPLPISQQKPEEQIAKNVQNLGSPKSHNIISSVQSPQPQQYSQQQHQNYQQYSGQTYLSTAETPQQQNSHGYLNRQDSASSALNLSSHCYIPNHTSLYGGSTSANTSMKEINVSHIRVNTADTAEIQHNIMPKQEIHQSLITNPNPFNKPPKAPAMGGNNQQSQGTNIMNPNMMISQQQQQQQQQQQRMNAYKTFPPQALQFALNQQQVSQNPQFVQHQNPIPQAYPQQINNNNNSMVNPQGFKSNQPQYMKTGGFFLSPSQLQYKGDQFSQFNNSSPPLHSRATSFNNHSALVETGGMQSTTSKSASQDFSLQSQSIMPNRNIQSVNASGFTTPQMNNNFIGSSNNFNYPARFYFPNQPDSIFGSPILPRNYHYDSASMLHTNYNLENSPPYDQDEEDDEHNQHHNINFIEKLVCDDDIDFKSGDELPQSNSSAGPSMMHSPQLSAVSGLRVPTSTFGPGMNMNAKLQSLQQRKSIWPPQSSNELKKGGNQLSQSSLSSTSRGLLQSSSAKSISGAIIEGGSSSNSEENKRPSTVHEQKTEEDAEDSSQMVINQRWALLDQQQNPLQQDRDSNVDPSENLWSRDVQLF